MLSLYRVSTREFLAQLTPRSGQSDRLSLSFKHTERRGRELWNFLNRVYTVVDQTILCAKGNLTSSRHSAFPKSLSTGLSVQYPNPRCLRTALTTNPLYCLGQRREGKAKLGPLQRAGGTGRGLREGVRCGFKPHANIHSYPWRYSSSGLASAKLKFCPETCWSLVQEGSWEEAGSQQ